MNKALFLLITIPFMLGNLHTLAQGTWSQKANMLGNARYNLLGFALGNKGYVAGGTYGGLSVTSDCQEFDPSSNTWTEKAPMPYAFRAGAAFGVSGRGNTTPWGITGRS
jgi:N-acetylneuraminic acid mutarotase